MSSLLEKALNNQRSVTARSHRRRLRERDSYDEEGGGSYQGSSQGSYDLHSTTSETTMSTAQNNTYYGRPMPSPPKSTPSLLSVASASPTNLKSPPKRSPSRRSSSGKGAATEEYQLQNDNGDDESTVPESSAEAHFRQNYAPCSTAFCFVQCLILPLMMWQCGIAPMNINPMIGPYPDALNYWGAKNAVLIIEDGEAWRLLTPIFLHAGLIHLAGNVMVQIDAGNQWEKEWGSMIWMIIYIGSALGSSILSTCCMPDNISVGSSGAVMGLFGAKLAEIVLLCCEKSNNLVEKAGARSRKQQTCLVVGGIVIVAAMSFIPYVDWAAHLGGMCAGFVLGLVCFSFHIRSWVFMIIWFVVGVGSTTVLYSLGIAYMYNEVETKDELRDVCGYYKNYFDDYECRCMLDEAIQFGSWQFGGGNNNSGDNHSGD
mmetsp:Transcript_515/g.1045  ORF Transcript_515/g.1045 Transcript_515/m.1045 type:complete len:429 (-) Transcript_515:100-1386(-)|eukprot:CAMPEP_0183736670 /NCGR_PEP_ID=MMETSP0737-20130205/49918_1 /TAXON_ID=385413 /ORGANISM="Thalassiosira miniscula, Strain CCMP1093" /LENGTH=428 /DNA_ID=CAMNT_0025970731 /DNA_START=155 /DNA_END=1441 /DNA_ORIENTATION=+